MRTQKATSKAASSKAAKAAPKAAAAAKGSKLASLKNALLGLGGGKKKDVSAKGPASNAKAAATAKATAPAKGAKGAAAAKAAAPAPAAPKGKGKAANPAAASHARGKAATAALNQIASAKAGGRAARQAESSEVCREVACEGLATSGGYCRLHYIKNWKKIQRKALILKEGKLNQYIEELVAKYPDKYIEAIRQDLTNDKDFAKVIYDLDLDESVDEFSEVEGENVDGLIDNIKREFDDEGEAF